jgi:hypothetical protein
MAMLKIGISDEAKGFVEEKAAREKTSEADIVRRALEAYRFLNEVKTEDGQILLQRKDGRTERLVRL